MHLSVAHSHSAAIRLCSAAVAMGPPSEQHPLVI